MGIKNESLSGLVKSFGEKANFGQIMSLLFQPVLVVFVISIWLMFMDALMNTLTIDNWFWEALQCREIVKGEQCCKVVDFMDICFKDFDSKVGTDAFFNYFTFAITNIIGVMLLWFMVFAVLKSNEITKKVAEKIQNIGENYLWSMPVIPWFDDKGRFWWDAVWVKGASSGIWSAWQSAIKWSEDTTGKTVVEPSLTRFYDNLSGKTNTAKDGVSKAVEDVATADLHTNTASREIFGNKLVEAIGNAKKNKYANANELLDASNWNIKKLLYHYDSDNALELLSNPRFIAETKSSSTKMADAFAINAWYGPWSANSKAEYYAKLKEQTDNLYKWIWSGKKIAGSANNVDLIEADEWVYKITKSWKQNEIYDVWFANISKESSLSDVTSGAEKLWLTYEQAKNLKLAEWSWKEWELKKTWELDRWEWGSIASFKDTTPPKEVNPPVASEADTP